MSKQARGLDALYEVPALIVFLSGPGAALALVWCEPGSTLWTLGGIVLLALTMATVCVRFEPYRHLRYMRVSRSVMLAFLTACVVVLVGDLFGF